jgi:tetratricopeptide (TPR) repeat protein
MGVEATKAEKLAHAVFLRRMSDRPATSPEVRLGQGGFLTLRLVDLLAQGHSPVEPDVFQYQWTATERYCAELAHEGTEAAHLVGIVRAAAEAYRRRDVRLLVPDLFAYVHYLEQTLHLEEALDVVEALASIGGARMSLEDQVATHLRLGHLNRRLARFDESDAAYAAAEQAAASAGNHRSVLHSRIGRAIGLMRRGNLPGAEGALLGILEDARSGADPDTEAKVEHVLGDVLDKRGRPDEGAAHLWRAYELYEDEAAKLLALGDLGIVMLRVGDVAGAERALHCVAKQSRQRDSVLNAQIELMHCASFRRDRLGFERWRGELKSAVDTMQPNVRADFYLKAGIGCARFGNYRKATELLDRASEVAATNKLHEFEFRIERIKAGLGDCDQTVRGPTVTAAEPEAWSEALREVSASLALLTP